MLRLKSTHRHRRRFRSHAPIAYAFVVALDYETKNRTNDTEALRRVYKFHSIVVAEEWKEEEEVGEEEVEEEEEHLLLDCCCCIHFLLHFVVVAVVVVMDLCPGMIPRW